MSFVLFHFNESINGVDVDIFIPKFFNFELVADWFLKVTFHLFIHSLAYKKILLFEQKRKNNIIYI